ncbi:MAG TPA: transcriptional regulator [Peptococcaceae bacterium]|nr:transcriptional regulator [Peptococcaceae bacterium]
MTKSSGQQTAQEKVMLIFKEHGGTLRTGEALKAGIHPRDLYSLRDQGRIEQVSRGVFRLSDLPPISNPDLVSVALRVPKAVICLISALSFHHLTTQVPHEVAIALERGAESPRIDFPPVSVHRFTKEAYNAGIEKHDIDGVKILVYNPEKTIADCFKFRNKLGLDVVLEALKLYKEKGRFNTEELMRYGRICRVAKIMKPYLEAMV